MGTTANFVKLRSTGTPKVGEWNINYANALALAKKGGKFIITCWSNGDACGYCTAAETCMMQSDFKNWMKTADAYFVFQYSGDKDKGRTLHDWIFTKTVVKYYPGFRITIYDASGKIAVDKAIDGNTLRNKKTGAAGAKAMVENLKQILASKPSAVTPTPAPAPKAEAYKVRFNEKLTTKQVNKILDALDANGGYCPCQAGKSADTKCHCKDFKESKKIGAPCICKIYVKVKA